MRTLFAILSSAMAVNTAIAEPVDYRKQIAPLFATRCASCHGALAQKAKLRVDTVAFMKQGGRSGPAIVPGKSAESLLVEAIVGENRDRMPPENEGAAFTKEQIALVRRWIGEGAIGPKDEPIPEDPRKHWAFQKPVRPLAPAASDVDWNRNPIDGFIDAEHVKHGLKPRPLADKATLLRRVTLDLTGLPPTREQLRAFLADESPDAYEKVVDRLLATPQYGERWARHWMDVWRYSDWYGRRNEKDWRNSSPTMWRWRDWIVRSLNADHGYDRMVREMLAADEIAPEDDDAQAATSFLVRNYYSLNQDTWMKDQVEHTAKAFLGLTLNCCHCHDHKYDPIAQEEYFRFRAFFEPIGLRQDRVSGEPDPGPFKKFMLVNGNGSGKPITSGLVRVMDERPDALTRMYRLGNERDFFPDKPPITPAAPAIVGGDQIVITPVMLPKWSSHPGMKPFVQAEETARAEKPLFAARETFHRSPKDILAGKRLAAAEADLRSVKARLAADNARFANGPGDPDTLSRKAAREEAIASKLAADVRLREAEEQVFDARNRFDAKALQAGEKLLAAARKSLAAAEQTLAKNGSEYTPIAPVYPTMSTGRRKALAEWITSRDNPLTARVAVNHIWMRHFGKPLVESAFDFGRNGKRPSHPQLIDWLAVELMDGNWSMKRLHKTIVTSRAYRMQSSVTSDADANLTRDPDNTFLWRYPARRIESEVVRDSLLFVTGELDTTLGGKELERSEEVTSRRRTLYFACHPEAGGSLRLVEFFDVPDPCDCYRRPDSLLPQQALALTNSDFSLDRSRVLARKLLAESEDIDSTITSAFEQLLTRRPTTDELSACRLFLAKQTDLVSRSATSAAAQQRAWESLVRVLFSHNDFITIR